MRELAQGIMDLFFVRHDVYGIELPQGWITVKKPVTLGLILQHLNGGPCLGAHVIDQQSRCRYIGWDMDEARKSQLIFARAKAWYPDSVLYNFTGGRGYHVRVFFNRPILSNVAFVLTKKLVEGTEGVECYPKQKWISHSSVGNFMRVPLGKHRKTGRVGTLIYPKSFSEIKPCSPPTPLTYNELKQSCASRIQDNLGYWNCVAREGAVGFCEPKTCPKVAFPK
jgi:hypothetical protein